MEQNEYLYEQAQRNLERAIVNATKPGLLQWEAEPRKAVIPFDTLWMEVTYKNWPQDDHWLSALIVQIDLYADQSCAKLLVDGLELSSFTVDQACVIEQNLDLYVQGVKR